MHLFDPAGARIATGTARFATSVALDGRRGRVALITGAAGDIGRAVAHRLAQQGWSLALVDHPEAWSALDETRQRCTRLGAPTWIDTFDVTDAGEVERSVRACRERVGVPTALFNNAGYQGAFERIDRYPSADASASSRSTCSVRSRCSRR